MYSLFTFHFGCLDVDGTLITAEQMLQNCVSLFLER